MDALLKQKSEYGADAVCGCAYDEEKHLLEQSGADEVAVLGALDTDNVHALVNQDLDVAVHTLAAGLDIKAEI